MPSTYLVPLCHIASVLFIFFDNPIINPFARDDKTNGQVKSLRNASKTHRFWYADAGRKGKKELRRNAG
jgi:hypothetical protein